MALLGQEQKLEDYQTIEPIPLKSNDIQVKETPTGKQSVYDLYDSLYNQSRELKPTFDPTTPEYLERTAKLNALGRGLSTLGDVFSLSRGGNVNRPTPDTKTGRYTDAYFKYLDDYRDKVDRYNLVDFNNRMRLGGILANQINRDEDVERAEKNRSEDVAYREKQANRSQSNADRSFDFQKQRYEEAPERQKEFYKFQADYQSQIQEAKRQNALQDWITKESLKVQFNKEKDKYILYDSTGKPQAQVDDEGQIQRLYHVITSDPSMKKEADAMMEVLKAELGEGITMNHMKIIVSKLWDRSDKAKEYLGVGQSQSQIPSDWQLQDNNQTQKETEQQSSMDYSTLKF